jgi:hypothetical protein
MLKLFVCAALVSAGAVSATPALAKDKPIVASAKSAAACDAKYYAYLVGKGVDEARAIEGADYRVVPASAQADQAQPQRMTIKVDNKNRIVEVACD